MPSSRSRRSASTSSPSRIRSPALSCATRSRTLSHSGVAYSGWLPTSRYSRAPFLRNTLLLRPHDTTRRKRYRATSSGDSRRCPRKVHVTPYSFSSPKIRRSTRPGYVPSPHDNTRPAHPSAGGQLSPARVPFPGPAPLVARRVVPGPCTAIRRTGWPASPPPIPGAPGRPHPACKIGYQQHSRLLDGLDPMPNPAPGCPSALRPQQTRHPAVRRKPRLRASPQDPGLATWTAPGSATGK